MTETTDKLTLQQLEDVRELCLPKTAWRSIIDELISAREQIEAERQRADAAESYARERDSENESIALTVGRLRTELAALRGEQEPAAWTSQANIDALAMRQPKRLEFMTGDKSVYRKPVALFTRQPKPVVVLPAEFFNAVQNSRGMFELSENCMCGITTALQGHGIVVKDGE